MPEGDATGAAAVAQPAYLPGCSAKPWQVRMVEGFLLCSTRAQIKSGPCDPLFSVWPGHWSRPL